MSEIVCKDKEEYKIPDKLVFVSNSKENEDSDYSLMSEDCSRKYGNVYCYEYAEHIVKCVNEHDKLVAEVDILKSILTSLVNLKRHKEQHGKTMFYEEFKERIWDDAKSVVDKEWEVDNNE